MNRLALLCIAALLAVAGCGGSSNSSSSSTTSSSAASGGGGGGTQLALSADANQLKYDKTNLEAPAGKVTITMTNQGSLSHDVALKGGVDEKGEVVGQGGKSVVTADLKPGQYTFYCSVDGHESAGMTGTLTIK